MKIKGSFLQKFLLVVQVVFMLTAIGIGIYMNVKHNYNLAALLRKQTGPCCAPPRFGFISGL